MDHDIAMIIQQMMLKDECSWANSSISKLSNEGHRRRLSQFFQSTAWPH